MQYRNAQRTDSHVIDCEINSPVHGWVPFTCNRDDKGALFDVVDLYDRMNADPATKPYIPPTQAELDAIAAQDVRAKRDRILATVVDPLVSNPLRWADMTPATQQAWADYRRALLDVPQQVGFPNAVDWPTQPA